MSVTHDVWVKLYAGLLGNTANVFQRCRGHVLTVVFDIHKVIYSYDLFLKVTVYPVLWPKLCSDFSVLCLLSLFGLEIIDQDIIYPYNTFGLWVLYIVYGKIVVFFFQLPLDSDGLFGKVYIGPAQLHYFDRAHSCVNAYHEGRERVAGFKKLF